MWLADRRQDRVPRFNGGRALARQRKEKQMLEDELKKMGHFGITTSSWPRLRGRSASPAALLPETVLSESSRGMPRVKTRKMPLL